MWPDQPLGVDFIRILFETDWCRRLPADALVRGSRCGAESLAGGRRHRCLLDPDHPGEHQCWCQRRFG
jgi:hypothetical protein